MNIRVHQWRKLKSLLKQRFPQLSDQDLVFESGKESELFVRLEEKTGKSNEELTRIVKGLQKAYLQHQTML